MKESSANRQIARATGTVMAAILFGQVTGLIRGILVARAFGASQELDAFFAANRVSETLFLLVAGGALGSAFIPTFTGLLAKKETQAAWRLASAIANSVTLTLGILALTAALFASDLVRYAFDLSRDPEIFSLTISLMRIQLISAVLFGLGGLIVGILNAHQIFLIPAVTPAMYQIGIILGTIFFVPSMGIFGLAWGVVLGSVLYLLIMIPTLIRQNGTYTFTLDLHNPNTRKVYLLMGPRLLGVAVVQLNFWVNLRLASQMPEGSITGLTYGFSLMLMAQAVIAQSAAIAVMPTFSVQHALGQSDALRLSLSSTLRSVIFLALPASLGLILLRTPVVAMLYQRGDFNERAVELVSWSLLWYSAGIVGHSIMEILTRAFYAQHDTKTPVTIGIFAMGLNVSLSILFSNWFLNLGWMPHGGLALANSLATALEAGLLFIIMRKRLGGINGKSILTGAFLALAGGVFMSAVILFWISISGDLNPWLTGLGGVILGSGTYLLTLWAIQVPEIRYIADTILSRLK